MSDPAARAPAPNSAGDRVRAGAPETRALELAARFTQKRHDGEVRVQQDAGGLDGKVLGRCGKPLGLVEEAKAFGGHDRQVAARVHAERLVQLQACWHERSWQLT